MSETAIQVFEIPEPLHRPDGWSDVGAVMTNFDHTIDDEIVALLLGGPHYAQHSAWNFCGYVWHAESVWFETVWRYNSPVASYSCPDLDTLRRHVNDEWGWE